MTDRPTLAYRHTPGAQPTLVFLCGYGSDMEGSKALALVKKLKAIDPPAAKATRYRSFVSTTMKQATLAEDAIAAAKAQQTDKAESLLKQAGKAGDRSDALAKKLKLSDCVKRYSANA